MDLFKFLRKNNNVPLETLLHKVADDPARKTEFLKRILTENLIVITNYDSVHEENNRLLEDKKVGIFAFDDGRTPVFTSYEKIFDGHSFSKDVKTVKGTGEYILKLLKGHTIVLNPFSKYQKEFSLSEIERLLNGTYFTNNLIETSFGKGASVTLSQPEKYPDDIIKSLTDLFSARPDVISAYIGWIYDPAKDEPPHYIFAINTIGEMVNLSSEAIFIVNHFLPSGQIVDFIQVGNGNFLDDYFIKSTKPFYTKPA